MSSFESRDLSTESTAGTSASLQNAPERGAFSQSTTGNAPLVNNGSYPVDPMLAAVRQEEARQLMMAAANASNNLVPPNILLAGGQLPSHDVYRYQQALMAQGGGHHGSSSHYGGGLHPMNSFPPHLAPPTLPPPPPPPPLPIAPTPAPMSATETSKSTVKPSRNEDKEPSDYKKKSKYKPYFDGSTVPDEESSSDEDDKILSKTRRGEEPLESITAEIMTDKERLNEPFPKKLYRIIEEAKENGQEDIISFCPHGRAFVIRRPKAFLEEIMPKYMTTSRMTSFQRQLNLYSFKRITEGKDKGGYYHEFFLQGRRGLLKKIKRKKPATPKFAKQDLDQAARISNAILASTKYAPTYSGNLGLMPDPMVQQQVAGLSQDDSYANAMRMRVFASSVGGPLSPEAARGPRDHLYPPGIETEASP